GKRIEDIRVKERHGRTWIEGRLRPPQRFQRHGVHLAVARDVEQLPSIATPARLIATGSGHLPTSLRNRKRAPRPLALASIIRGVRHPFAIWRKLAMNLIERAVQIADRFALHLSVFAYRKNPKILPGLGTPL